MAVTFQYREYLADIFGKVRRPVARVYFERKDKSWFPIDMIIDTGADYTLLPKSVAIDLGISVEKDCTRAVSRGVGGSTNIYFLKKKIRVKIGNYLRRIPLGFIQDEMTPPLLGRQEFFETFKVTFNKFKVTFE